MLSQEKQGQIALAVFKLKFKEEAKIPKAAEMKRNIGNVSKKIGFSKEELTEFMILLVKENTSEFISEMEIKKDK